MQINKDSWHYKLWERYTAGYYYSGDVVTICSYVRTLVLNALFELFLFTLFFGVVGGLVVNALYGLYVIITHWYLSGSATVFGGIIGWIGLIWNDIKSLEDVLTPYQVITVALFVGFVMVALTAAATFVCVYSYFKYYDWKLAQVKEVKKAPSIFSEYIKAIKTKTCTIVEFK